MKLYRCNICGEVYSGNDKPTHCPYCGAHANFLLDSKIWKDDNQGVVLSEKTQGFLEETLRLEISASRLYRGVSKESKNVELQSLFKYLAKVEMEHAEVAAKLLGRKVPDEVLGIDKPSETDKENLEESLRREEHATQLYRGFAKDAEEIRAKVFFSALAQVENDHIMIDKEELGNISD